MFFISTSTVSDYPIYSDCKHEKHDSIHGVCFPTMNKEHGITYFDSCVLRL